ncbi:hypothetical protein AFK24_09700 [Pseudomonas syringae]|uniref:Uncharacterized protein n=1 Tax=Pseudomonas syringae TaxID=317 RepID=A0A1C7Z8P8_PSESX|nr:hypothetical protein AFK24_09700 [Pseudomonas syringae]
MCNERQKVTAINVFFMLRLKLSRSTALLMGCWVLNPQLVAFQRRITDQVTRIARLSTGGRQIVLHSLANALDALSQARIVKAITRIGVWCFVLGCLLRQRVEGSELTNE